MLTDPELQKLIEDYTPVLVLYPEISSTVAREQNWNKDFKENGESPLSFDYHPRDVRLVLESSIFHEWFRWFRRRKNPTTWQGMLDRLERTKYRKNLDVFPKIAPEDRGEFWVRYGAIDKDANPDYARACYARATYNDDNTELVVQYWYAYLYNDFWNVHEMDWEAAMVAFDVSDAGAVPRICAASAHARGHKLDWHDVEKANGDLQLADDGTHPVVYVAHGSHAGYLRGPGRFFTAPEFVSRAAAHFNREQRQLVDYTTPFSAETAFLVAAAVIPNENGGWLGDWRWMNHGGRWGSPGDWDLEFGDSGPHGPKQGLLKWQEPFAWIDKVCQESEFPE